MIPEKYQNESDTIKQLFSLGSPHDRKTAYLNQWDDHLAQGFTDEDIPTLISLVLDTETVFSQSESTEGWACLYAWRTLGQLKSTEAISPLMSIIDLAGDNDWLLGELPTVMGMIGESAIEPLSHYLINSSSDEFSRVTASDGLAKIAKFNPEMRDTIVAKFGEYLKSPDQNLDGLNGLVVCSLMDLKATELIDLIRPLYEQDLVDITTSGDLEDVEIGLGLRSKRETPKPHYGITGSNTEFKSALSLGDDDWENSFNLPNNQTFVRDAPKLGRNDPCPCGSGKKYKKCCLNK